MSSLSHGGRHELGQNFLVNRSVISTFQDLVAQTAGPIVEIGAGDGALTLPMSRTGRPITAIQVDSKRARRLRQRAPSHVTVVTHDFLNTPAPPHPHVVVGNIPFHLTTAILRRILAGAHWHTAVLLVQWEVARRRAGVGGASMLTASWWPWYEFTVHARVPAHAFRPVPAVDGGLLTIARRDPPLVADRARYQAFVKQVFTGRGRGIDEILARTGQASRTERRRWLSDHGLSPLALPKDITADQWASLWHIASVR